MPFYIQDPTILNSYTLHEALLQASIDAECGGGSYAFVSQEGVRLLLEDDYFKTFISDGKFKLVVGVDEITNENTLKRLQSLMNRHKGLEITAFLHEVKGATFHPKFSWFRKRDGGVLVVGSGNLTAKGLRRNWEAFSVLNVDGDEIAKIERIWNDWLELCSKSKFLQPLDNEKVLEKARSNLRVTVFRGKRGKPRARLGRVEAKRWQEGVVPEDVQAWDFDDNDQVLIAEIPKGGTRWNQANFDIHTFSVFFGAKPGDNSLRILLRNVLKDGTLADFKIRQSVSVKSRNFRFELEVSSKTPYPSTGRPISVFIRVSTRMFLYILAMPGDSYYNCIRQFLDGKYRGGTDTVKRIYSSVEELRKSCKDLPFWKIANS
jgi:HKD family nuclease